jgi:hypothetical protein
LRKKNQVPTAFKGLDKGSIQIVWIDEPPDAIIPLFPMNKEEV